METLSGFNVYPVEFTNEGKVFKDAQKQELAAAVAKGKGVTDLFVFSHGWNNDMKDAHDNLYAPLLASMRGLVASNKHPLKNRKVAVLAVYWPSKKFAEEDLIPGGGAAGLHDADVLLLKRLDTMRTMFDGSDKLGSPADADSVRTIDHLKALVPSLERSQQAQDEFARLVRSLFPGNVNEEESVLPSDFQTLDGDDLLSRLSRPFHPRVVSAGGAAGGVGPGAGPRPDQGGAVGLGNLFGGIKNGAMNLLNLFTYYEMKNRAGLVGANGLHEVLRSLQTANPDLRLHLAGHSFGGRVVSAAAAAGDDGNALQLSSLSLLQSAFSHWGFAKDYEPHKDGFFRAALGTKRLKGPMMVTHTPNDKAVGLAYPIASRLKQQVASAIGDKDDPYGGIGRNGAQKTPEVDVTHGVLLDITVSYVGLTAGKICNLEGSKFIKSHGDVHSPQVAHAILSAVEALA